MRVAHSPHAALGLTQALLLTSLLPFVLACGRPILPSVDTRQPSFVTVDIPRAAGSTETYPLLVGVTEVTVAQWRSVMGTERSGSGCDNCAETMVSWYDAAAYANALSVSEGLSPCYELSECTEAAPYQRRRSPGNFWSHEAGLACNAVQSRGPSCSGYRLPTRAEWEAYGDVAELGTRPRHIGRHARVSLRPSAGAGVVATRLPNEHGLYDTLGNVEEWLDTHTATPSEMARSRREAGHAAWFLVAATCFRSRYRDVSADHLHHEMGSWAQDCQGFRLVRSAPPPAAT